MTEKIFRTAKVNYQGKLAGILSETEHGFRFVYDQNYLQHGQPISVSLPLRREPYESEKLFSFFEGLLPEGWYLDVVRATVKIDVKDSFGLLLATTGDAIGAGHHSKTGILRMELSPTWLNALTAEAEKRSIRRIFIKFSKKPINIKAPWKKSEKSSGKSPLSPALMFSYFSRWSF